MKIAVIGLWHLGCVTAACLAKAGHQVIAYDADASVVSQLEQNVPPIFEPHLTELLREGKDKQQIQFSSQINDISAAEIIWVTIDTPVNENDEADVAYVTQQVMNAIPVLQDNALVLISSQVPVGTTRKLAQQCQNKTISFGCIPENLRLGKAIDVFMKPDRYVVGLQNQADQARVKEIFQSITDNIVWMSIESAEMTKHALNAFLSLSVTFINEIASLCEKVGADAREVENGLKSEERIGAKAYLRPGGAIGGGTLLRDVNYLMQAGVGHGHPTRLMSAVIESNHYHKDWLHRKVAEVLADLKNKTIAVLGLTYKSHTDTLRRSTAVETCQWLKQQGVTVQAFDPAIQSLPLELQDTIQLKTSIDEAVNGSDALIIATEWPHFREAKLDEMMHSMKQSNVFDPNGFIQKLMGIEAVNYFSVGRSL